jgi:hypothetical protein
MHLYESQVGSYVITINFHAIDRMKRETREIHLELKINPVLEHIDQQRKQHVQRMDRSRIPRQIMTYRPKGKRSLGRPLKRWRETVTGH